MQLVRPCRHELCSDKLTAPHKIVFVADVHAGSAQDFSTLEKAVAEMAAEQPEAIILGGDITDDYTSREEMEAVCRLFGGLLAALRGFRAFGPAPAGSEREYQREYQ